MDMIARRRVIGPGLIPSYGLVGSVTIEAAAVPHVVGQMTGAATTPVVQQSVVRPWHPVGGDGNGGSDHKNQKAEQRVIGCIGGSGHGGHKAEQPSVGYWRKPLIERFHDRYISFVVLSDGGSV